MKLTRDLYIPLIDRNRLTGASSESHDWVRIDKSTIFELSFNPQEETYSYINSANDVTEITSYSPELPQEIVLDSDNELYAAMFEFCMSMPVGADAVVPCLVVTPDATGKAARGFLWAETTVSPQSLNSVDGKLSFTLKLNGTPVEGTVTASGGDFTFTAN